MSSLIVEVSKIDSVHPHPNADRLELAQIKGWQCVVPKAKYSTGDLVTYVPVDSVLPAELAERLGVTNYLGVNGRVRCAKLRGEPSFGLIIDREDVAWAEGHDVAEHYGITKYIPPVKISAGDAERPSSLFISYTGIENFRNFNRSLIEGEEVIATEKIHGTNCRVGICEEDGQLIEMAGSKEIRRRRPTDAGMATDIYWFPWTVPGVAEMLRSDLHGARQIILFGEVYGRVQSLKYGVKDLAFRAFDLFIDGKYLDYDDFLVTCETFGIETAPQIYRGPMNVQTLKELSDGQSTLPGANNIREGIVVRPVKERTDPRLGRVILKFIGDSYLLGDKISDTNDV